VSEEIAVYMTKPDKNGTPAPPRRSAPKGMLPSTWLNRTLRLEYTDCYGVPVETSGVLLDTYPAGPIVNIAGSKTLLSWDRLAVVQLVEEGGG
jgi:hypothetical protein